MTGRLARKGTIPWKSQEIVRQQKSCGNRSRTRFLALRQFGFDRGSQASLDARGKRIALRQGTDDANCVGVRVDDDAAPPAPSEVDFERLAVLDHQLAADVVVQHRKQLFAGHATPPSKCGASASRIRSRARCNRLFTAGTLRPSISPISALGKPS